MENALILIVEDEPQIAEIARTYFEREGFRTVTASDGEMGIAHHRQLSPDLVVLDVKLPKKDGHEVLARIRASSTTPVIMATALGEDLDKLSALKIGADDYIVKPFNPLELVARAKEVLRRTAGQMGHATTLRVDSLEVDLSAHVARTVLTSGKPVTLDLTLTEFRILAHMARTATKAFTRAELLDACLPPDGDALERTVDRHISKLRRKLEQSELNGYLEGVRGIGYRLKSA